MNPALAAAVRESLQSGHAQAADPESVSNAPDLGPRKKWSSVIVAPLIARDMPLGAIVCCLLGSRRHFEPADLALIENLASRAATALG